MASKRKSNDAPDDIFSVLAKKTKRSIDEVKETWSERAAIREYVGGMSRLEAELAAIKDTEDVLAR